MKCYQLLVFQISYIAFHKCTFIMPPVMYEFAIHLHFFHLYHFFPHLHLTSWGPVSSPDSWDTTWELRLPLMLCSLLSTTSLPCMLYIFKSLRGELWAWRDHSVSHMVGVRQSHMEYIHETVASGLFSSKWWLCGAVPPFSGPGPHWLSLRTAGRCFKEESEFRRFPW